MRRPGEGARTGPTRSIGSTFKKHHETLHPVCAGLIEKKRGLAGRIALVRSLSWRRARVRVSVNVFFV